MTANLLLFLILLAEAFLLYRLFKRISFHPFPHGILIYLMLGKIVLFASYQGYLDYDFLRVWSSYAHVHYYSQLILLLFCLFLFYYITTLGIHIKVKKQQLAQFDVAQNTLIILCFLLWFRAIYHIMILDFDVIMSNSQYLMMASMNAIKTDAFLGKFVQQSNKFFGLIVMVLFAFTFARKRWLLMVILTPLMMWHFTFELAGHSRYAALYMFTIAGIYGLVKEKRKIFTVSLFSILGVSVLFIVLAGRVSGEHGFTALLSMSEKFTDISTGRVSTNVIANGFEGLFVVSEVFTSQRHFDDIYKNLSLSPFPSFIDGFASIRAANEIRLHKFVPMGAIAEIIHFGTLYVLIYFGMQFITIRLSYMVMRRTPGVLPIVLNMILLVSSYLQFTYSTRTVFRFYVIVFLLSIFLLFIDALKQHKATSMHRKHKAMHNQPAIPLGRVDKYPLNRFQPR